MSPEDRVLALITRVNMALRKGSRSKVLVKTRDDLVAMYSAGESARAVLSLAFIVAERGTTNEG